MNKTAVSIALTIALVCSVYLNIFFLTDNQTINQPRSDFLQFTHEFGNVQVISDTYGFTPPVTKYQALRSALESDNWAAADLQNMTVRVSLDYCQFQGDPMGGTNYGFQLNREVTSPVDDYSPQTVNGTTYRYVWTITVDLTQNLGLSHHPPYGLYYVDAKTGELVPHGHLF